MAKKKTIQPKLRFKNEEGKDYPDWEEKTLEEMCSNFKSGINITSKDIAEKGLYPVYGGNGLRGYSNSYTHEGFFVLIGRQGALCGNINRANGKTYISEHAIAVQANEENDTEWLAQKLQLMNLNRLSESSAQPGLAVGKLLKLKVFAPSLEEQKKIAEFLSAIDDKIENLEKELEELKAYKKGVMQAIFAAASDATERRLKIEALQDTKKHGFFIRFKDENGEDYPDWVEETLGEVTIFLDNQRKPIKESDRAKMRGEFPYYGASGIIDFVNDFLFDDELILLGEDGENIMSRNLPLAFKVSGKCWVNNHAHVIKPKANIDINFLTQYLESISYEKYNTGTAQPKLNQEVCKKIPVFLPSLQEQIKIGAFLSSIDQKVDHSSNQIQNTRQYKQALLQQLFN